MDKVLQLPETVRAPEEALELLPAVPEILVNLPGNLECWPITKFATGVSQFLFIYFSILLT